MHYGWYLLGDLERGLVRANIVSDVVPYGPLNVELALVGASSDDRIEYARFTRIVDELVAMNLVSVRLSGGGDPFSHPRFVEMLRYLESHGVAVEQIVSPCTALTDDVIRCVIETRAHTLEIHLEDVGESRGGAPSPSNERAFERIQSFCAERDLRGVHLPKLRCVFHLDAGNAGRAAEMIEYARGLRAGAVTFEPVAGREPVAALASMGAEEREVLERRMAEVLEQGDGIELAGSLLDVLTGTPIEDVNESAPARRGGLLGRLFGGRRPKVLEAERETGARGICILPWFHVFVDAELDVWPCRELAGEGGEPLGNLRAASVSEVWNGAGITAIRRASIDARTGDGLPPHPAGTCPGCRPGSGIGDESFVRETESWIARRRSGTDVEPFPDVASPHGFALPALVALQEHFPRSAFEAETPEIVARIHAEAEIARIEALALRVRAASLEARSTWLLRHTGSSEEAMGALVEAEKLKQDVRGLERYSEWLFGEAGRVGGIEHVVAARPPFETMLDWLPRLAAVDDRVETDMDHQYVIWMSMFKTLADYADMSEILRVMGVGVGFEGPEVFYNDHFPEHYCLDLVDYSARNPKLTFITANIEEHVDFPDAHFDLVYSHSVFEHLKDVNKAIAEIDRLVALGRYIYITICPLYYSPSGSHVNVPTPLRSWEHLDPSSEYYLLDSPDPKRIDEGVYLNKLRVAEFLEAVGRVGWEIRHFSLRIVHPRDVPKELQERFPVVDLATEEFRFVGRKVIPKSEGVEW